MAIPKLVYPLGLDLDRIANMYVTSGRFGEDAILHMSCYLFINKVLCPCGGGTGLIVRKQEALRLLDEAELEAVVNPA